MSWCNPANFEKIIGHKATNPSLKLLLSLDGWNFNECGSAGGSTCGLFREMVGDPVKRATFIASFVEYLRTWGFDGLDLDWEYPAVSGHNLPNATALKDNKDNFVTFLSEYKAAYEAEGLATGRARVLLTAAVGVGQGTVEKAYDVQGMSENLDFINLMAYDMHGSWEAETGHQQCPLREIVGGSVLNYSASVEWAVEDWIAKGAAPQKLVVGTGTFGRSFELASEAETGFRAPAVGGGAAGPFTRAEGFVAYYEILEQIENGGATVVYDEEREVPYAHWGKPTPNIIFLRLPQPLLTRCPRLGFSTSQNTRSLADAVPHASSPLPRAGNQWVGYDNERSIAAKAKFVEERARASAVEVDRVVNEEVRGLHERQQTLSAQQRGCLDAARREVDEYQRAHAEELNRVSAEKNRTGARRARPCHRHVMPRR